MTEAPLVPGWPLAHRQWQGGRRYQEDDSGALDVEAVEPGDLPALLMVLADGMGGEAGGATASDTVVRTFIRQFEDSTGSIHTRLRDCLAQATISLTEQEEDDPRLEGMGSTVVAAFYDGRRVSWLSVGDSPMWLFADGRLQRLNDDHSMVPVLESLVRDGEMTREEALGDRRRNMLRSAVTSSPAELVDCTERSCRLRPGDYLLIASDGLETLSEEEIEQCLDRAGGGSEDAAGALLSAVRDAAGPGQDNVTFLLLSGESAADDRAARRMDPAGVASEAETAVRSRSRSHRQVARLAAVLAVGLLAGILVGSLGSNWLGGSDPFGRQLEDCETRFVPDSLTEDRGKAAIDCYRQVQALDPENIRAREGLRRVFGKYKEWADAALKDKDRSRAQADLKKLKELSPEARAVGEIERGIAQLRKRAAEAKELAAEAKELAAAAKELAAAAKELAAEVNKLEAAAVAAKKAAQTAVTAAEDARNAWKETQTKDEQDATKKAATETEAKAAEKKAKAAEKKAEEAEKKAEEADKKAKAAEKKAEAAEKKAKDADQKAKKAKKRATAAKKRAG